MKAVVLGAAGGIGQPLSLLLKANPLITKLSLYDIVNTPGVASDLAHISTGAVVEGYLPEEKAKEKLSGDGAKEAAGLEGGLKRCLEGAEVVVIPAGVPRKPGMTRDDLFKINAGIVRDLATGIATSCPKAAILVISNPVNSTVPIVAEVMKKHGVYDPRKLFGVTTLDVVRASTFVAEVNKDVSAASKVVVPVIGGHSGVTIIPLLSLSSHPVPKHESTIAALTNRIQFGGDEVVKAKDGAGSATLSMAYAGAEFADKVVRALGGEKGIVAPSFVNVEALGERTVVSGKVGFFSLPVELGVSGVERVHDVGGRLSGYEEKLLEAAIPELEGNIQKGVQFVTGSKL